MQKSYAFAVAIVLGLAAPAGAQAPAAVEKPAGKPEVSIPFVRFGGIDDWREDGNQALYIKGRGMKEWYYAKLMSPCTGLPFAHAIGFKNEPTDTFDRFSSIWVDGQRCQLTSLTASEPPPSKKEMKEKKAKEKAAE